MGVSTAEGKATMMEAALAYAGNGVPVFPVWRPTDSGGCECPKGMGCVNAGKHPVGTLVPNGLNGATADSDRVREWWDQYPEANIGMPTGAWSGVVVLDVDRDKGGFDSLLGLMERYGILPETRVVHTGGGGLHFYFEHPGFHVRNSAGSLGPGLDLRGDGGFVLLPPSVHATNRTYAWQGAWNGG